MSISNFCKAWHNLTSPVLSIYWKPILAKSLCLLQTATITQFEPLILRPILLALLIFNYNVNKLFATKIWLVNDKYHTKVVAINLSMDSLHAKFSVKFLQILLQ